MCLPLCGVNTFLCISLFWCFDCSRCKLVNFLVMSIQFLSFSSHTYILLIVHPVLHHANFFYAFSELFFHIAKPVFILVCLYFVFIPQSNVSFCSSAWEEWVCLDRFPIVLWLLSFSFIIYLSIYFYLTGRSLITKFVFWRIYPV